MGKLDNLKPFKKGQSGNPKGRPKKTVNQILGKLQESGYEIPSSREIKDTYLYLCSMPEEKLKDFISDKDCPMLFRICATNILSKKGFDILEKMLDRAIGKPTQKTEITGEDGEKVEFTINVIQGDKTMPYDPD